MLTEDLAKIYVRLASCSDKANPPVLARGVGSDRLVGAAQFATHDIYEDYERVRPHIRVARPEGRVSSELKPEDADLCELISLAHERGHEMSWRAGTYVPMTMPEEHRAWSHAETLLRGLGFGEWAEYADAKRYSLEEHRKRGTPDGEVGAEVIRELAAAMHHRTGGAINIRVSDWQTATTLQLVDEAKLSAARRTLDEDRSRWIYDAERFRLAKMGTGSSS